MGILKIVEASVKKASSSKEILAEFQQRFPVNEFRVEAEQYKEFTDLLLAKGRKDLVKNVFVKGQTIDDKQKADWDTISTLTKLHAGDADVKTDKDLQKVYIRLAALAKGIAGQDKSITKKLDGRAQTINKVYGLLTDSNALQSLLNANVSVKGELTETAKDKTASVDIKYTQNVAIGTKGLLGTIGRFSSRNLAKKLEQEILDSFLKVDFSKVGAPELTERYFNKAVRELDQKLAAKIPEFREVRKFNTTKLAILKGSVGAEVRKASEQAKELSKAIETVRKRADIAIAKSPASLLFLLNSAMESAIKGNEVFPGRMEASGAAPDESYLRWQTGTFGTSVEALTAEQSGDVLSVTYDYKRKPYEDLYTEHGSMSANWFTKEGRDVEFIAESAIQDIATELISKSLGVVATPI